MATHAAVLTACVFWAVSFIATKAALAAVPPLSVVTLRLLVSALCFAPLLWRRRAGLLCGGPGRFGRLFLLSLAGTGLHYGVQTVGLQYTSASNASLWAMTCPLGITLIAALFLGERLTARKAAGLALALAGVLVVLGPDALSSGVRAQLLGDGLVFLSIFMWAVFTVYGKKLNAELGALELAGASTILGALTMLPLGLWEASARGFSPAAVPASAWWAILFLGAGCGFLSTLLYFVALERTESQKVGVYLYTIPPMTYLAAALLLGERVGPALLAGSALVAAGVYITERG
ncbi:MAG: DMT family transporter [Elusimicrobiota bacterium]|jgi:drug/metabolite transporter (DMT)-like permease